MADKLSEINELLDELLVKQLELMQDYIGVTAECESHQKSGFINLAKARYIQGFHSVSKNCLFSEDSEEERQAIVTVTRQNSTIALGGKEEENTFRYQEPSLSISTDVSLQTQLNKQFGFLSSGTLKHAKIDFRNCLEKTVERAKIIEQSLALKQRYKELMKEKLDIENSDPNA